MSHNMFLFLDVVNPIPEFFIFDDNKLILSKKIIYNDSQKLSDYIFQSYIEINTQLNLNKYITKVGITIGPGSFTSLRVGAALISGIYISKNLPFCTISAYDIINFKSDKKLLQNTGVFMHSANDQKFFCNLNKDKIIEYSKIEDKEFSLPKNIDLIYYNHKKMDLHSTNCNQIEFSFENEVLKNLEKIKFITNNIIKPIYISNNSILN